LEDKVLLFLICIKVIYYWIIAVSGNTYSDKCNAL
jgi:hypothetical protein